MRRTNKQKRPKTQLERTAYHEAGHAVMHWQLDRPFRYVTIKSGNNSLGHVASYKARFLDNEGFDHRKPTHRAWLEDRVLISLAGAEAEKHFSGRYNYVGAEGDAESTGHLVAQVYGGPELIDPYMRFMRLVARRTITSSRVWPFVKAVALLLLEREHLTSRACREVTSQVAARELKASMRKRRTA